VKIVIPGGTGQVGTILARAFHQQGHDVVVLTRTPGTAPWRTAPWNAETLDGWANEFENADVVVNLAGRSVNCRYTEANRRAIKDSRVNSTRIVAKAIARADSPPSVWLQMSTATIYSHRYDEPNDEVTGCVGGSEPDAPDPL
jgi:NAD dependent epimerase/dehydratase family enzyme